MKHGRALQIKAKYRESHRELLKQKNREYRARMKVEKPGYATMARREYCDKHREEVNAYARNRRKLNPEALLASREACRRYRLRNLEMQRERDRLYSRAYPEKNRAKARKRRARKYSAQGSHTQSEIDRLMKAQHNRCADCGGIFSKGFQPTLDHVIPLSKGGSEYIENLRWVCLSCNCTKNSTLPDVWAKSKGLLFL